jgi:tRNA pseudouridine13 synthase
LQAAVFNQVLRERPLALGRLERGDVAVVHASGGLFEVEDVARENQRADEFEISPTGPIFGLEEPEPSGAPGLREAAACKALGVPPRSELSPPRGIRLPGSRRPLRIRPADLEMDLQGEVLRVRFALQRGSFATVLLEELGLLAASPG